MPNKVSFVIEYVKSPYGSIPVPKLKSSILLNEEPPILGLIEKRVPPKLAPPPNVIPNKVSPVTERSNEPCGLFPFVPLKSNMSSNDELPIPGLKEKILPSELIPPAVVIPNKVSPVSERVKEPKGLLPFVPLKSNKGVNPVPSVLMEKIAPLFGSVFDIPYNTFPDLESVREPSGL